MKKIFSFIWEHNKIAAPIILVVLVAGGYFGYKQFSEDDSVRYITTEAAKDMLISSVSGTGQVSASNQIDINAKVAGDVVLVKAKRGQEVKEGDLIVQIDSRDAARKVNEAKASLENARLELEELLAPVDAYTLLQAENTLIDAQDSLTKLKTTQANNYQDALDDKQKAIDNLEKAYEDAYNEVSNAFLDFPAIMTGIYTVLFSEGIADSEPGVGSFENDYALINAVVDSDKRTAFENYVNGAKDDYSAAKDAYDQNFDDYKEANRYSDKAVIAALLDQTLETTKKISDTVKSESNMLDYWVEYRTDSDFKVYSQVSSYQSSLSSYTAQVNSCLSSLLAAQRSIEDYKEAISSAERSLAEMGQNQPLELAAAERSIQEKQIKLNDLKAGATELEVKNKQLAVQQKENSLIEAQQSYGDYFIRAPFDGVLVEMDIAKGDSISSATAVATLITNQRIAEITLNEIDAAQVEEGQKVILEFDAIEDLSITGKVAEIDALGTVSQGVVSYNVKIAFDVQDERVKPGMSISASIILESKSGTLLVPISAVKVSGNSNYVEVLVDEQLQRKTVVTGASNDTMIEIVEGLSEGDVVVTQTISGDNNTSQNTSNGGMGSMRMMMPR